MCFMRSWLPPPPTFPSHSKPSKSTLITSFATAFAIHREQSYSNHALQHFRLHFLPNKHHTHTHTRTGARKNFPEAENLFSDQVVANVRNVESLRAQVEPSQTQLANGSKSGESRKSFLVSCERNENQVKADCEQMKKVPSRLRGRKGKLSQFPGQHLSSGPSSTSQIDGRAEVSRCSPSADLPPNDLSKN